MQKFRDVLSRWERKELSAMEAGEILGVSERQFRRYRHRYEEDGLAGACGPAAWQGVVSTGADRQGRLDAGSVPDPSHGLEREAFPRALATAAWLRLGLHLDQAAVGPFDAVSRRSVRAAAV